MARGLSAVEAAARGPRRDAALAVAAPAYQLEYEFVLPRGYVDERGQVHREGTMRLATARDELLPLLDARVQQHAAFLSIVLLGRVVPRLGDLADGDASVIEDMFATDVAFLQDLYRRINTGGHTQAAVCCPACATE